MVLSSRMMAVLAVCTSPPASVMVLENLEASAVVVPRVAASSSSRFPASMALFTEDMMWKSTPAKAANFTAFPMTAPIEPDSPSIAAWKSFSPLGSKVLSMDVFASFSPATSLDESAPILTTRSAMSAIYFTLFKSKFFNQFLPFFQKFATVPLVNSLFAFPQWVCDFPVIHFPIGAEQPGGKISSFIVICFLPSAPGLQPFVEFSWLKPFELFRF